eukprot:s125_g39.t1
MANEELLQKLRRQRLRMGEDPLPLPVGTRPLDQTKERRSRRDELVTQRARKFQSTDSPGPSPSRTPGRINLDCWEQRCREKIGSSQPCMELGHQLQDPSLLSVALLEGESNSKKAPEAECFCMWDSEEENCRGLG